MSEPGADSSHTSEEPKAKPPKTHDDHKTELDFIDERDCLMGEIWAEEARLEKERKKLEDPKHINQHSDIRKLISEVGLSPPSCTQSN